MNRVSQLYKQAGRKQAVQKEKDSFVPTCEQYNLKGLDYK